MKIAIVKLSALGDIVHAMAALQFIKAARPDIQIDWLVEQSLAEILADNPDIDTVLTINLKALKSNKLGVFQELRKVKTYAASDYDLVVDAQGLIKSAIVARLLSGNCVGFDKYSCREWPAAGLYRTKFSYPYDANTIDRNVAILTRPLGLEVGSGEIIRKQPFLFHRPPRPAVADYWQAGQPAVVLVTGSTWPSRNYPKEKYLQIVQSLAVNCLLIWGNDQEYRVAEWIAQRSSAQVLPRLSLNDLKAVIAKADLVIGNDTGPTHMAWGLNRPSITLFGPTPVSRVYQTSINKVLKSSSQVNPFKLDKNDFSIGEISVKHIVDLAMDLLKR
ncbi:MAG: lipopolysaccharide heptosyltransferase I [Methylomonas sp.]|jgi:heptosyltransferase-1